MEDQLDHVDFVNLWCTVDSLGPDTCDLSVCLVVNSIAHDSYSHNNVTQPRNFTLAIIMAEIHYSLNY